MNMQHLDPLSNKNGHHANMQKLTKLLGWQKHNYFFNFGGEKKPKKNVTLQNRVHNVINYKYAYLQLEQNQSSSGAFMTFAQV